jgi:hypothetical protein
MRRHAAPDWRRRSARFSRDCGAHLVLLLYWLLSGYALRVSRAFVALALILLVFASCSTSLDFTTPMWVTRSSRESTARRSDSAMTGCSIRPDSSSRCPSVTGSAPRWPRHPCDAGARHPVIYRAATPTRANDPPSGRQSNALPGRPLAVPRGRSAAVAVAGCLRSDPRCGPGLAPTQAVLVPATRDGGFDERVSDTAFPLLRELLPTSTGVVPLPPPVPRINRPICWS